MTDIGTGSYTIIAQTAAEMMGVPLDKVVVRLGDSDFPGLVGSGGQWGANNSTVRRLCGLRQAARGGRAESSGSTRPMSSFADGKVRSGNRSVPLAEAAADGELVAEDTIEFGDLAKNASAIDLWRAFRRGRRRCRDGRNPRPADARGLRCGPHPEPQVGAQPGDRRDDDGCRRGVDGGTRRRQALRLLRQPRSRGYEVPVHADIPHQDVIFLDETDPMSSPMKAKGVGELGLCGVARRWRMRSITRPASACATIRSRWTSCSTDCLKSDDHANSKPGAGDASSVVGALGASATVMTATLHETRGSGFRRASSISLSRTCDRYCPTCSSHCRMATAFCSTETCRFRRD